MLLEHLNEKRSRHFNVPWVLGINNVKEDFLKLAGAEFPEYRQPVLCGCGPVI